MMKGSKGSMEIKEMTIEMILFRIKQFSAERATNREKGSDSFYAKELDALCDEVKRRVSENKNA